MDPVTLGALAAAAFIAVGVALLARFSPPRVEPPAERSLGDLTAEYWRWEIAQLGCWRPSSSASSARP